MAPPPPRTSWTSGSVWSTRWRSSLIITHHNIIIIVQEFLSEPDTCIGVHCVTGLGRAPVLVATALIELGMKYEVRRKKVGIIGIGQVGPGQILYKVSEV